MHSYINQSCMIHAAQNQSINNLVLLKILFVPTKFEIGETVCPLSCDVYKTVNQWTVHKNIK